MNKRTVAFCCFAWAGVILSASPADALIVLTESVTSARVSSQVVYSEATFCDGTVQTYYLQRMRIGRKWMWVPVDRIYSAGLKDLVLEDITCSDGTHVYEAFAPISAVAASRYRELALPASLDRLDGKANTQLGEYCSPLRRDEPDGNPPTRSSALAGEDRRRYSPRSVLHGTRLTEKLAVQPWSAAHPSDLREAARPYEVAGGQQSTPEPADSQTSPPFS